MIPVPMHDSLWPYVVNVLEWVGTLVFALSGGLLGVKKQFDLFGVLFLSFVVSVAGGIMRDVLIGAVPPAAITEIHYFAIAICGGLLTFLWAGRVVRYQRLILLLDAVGLSLFAVLGTRKAIDHDIQPVMAAVLGMLTGIGGGMTRDVLAGDIPSCCEAPLASTPSRRLPAAPSSRPATLSASGVFTLEFVPKGKILSIWQNFTLHTEEEYNAREGDKPFRWNAVRLVGKWYGYQEGGTSPEDCINHSYEPNVLFFMGNLFAIKDILAGEELFIDYNYYNSPQDRFKRFVDIRTGRPVNGLTPRDCMLRACQIMTKLLEDSEDWDGM